MEPEVIDLRKLKRYALEKLPSNSRLRELLLLEPDELEAHEAWIKAGMWLKLAELEASKKVKR